MYSGSHKWARAISDISNDRQRERVNFQKTFESQPYNVITYNEAATMLHIAGTSRRISICTVWIWRVSGRAWRWSARRCKWREWTSSTASRSPSLQRLPKLLTLKVQRCNVLMASRRKSVMNWYLLFSWGSCPKFATNPNSVSCLLSNLPVKVRRPTCRGGTPGNLRFGSNFFPKEVSYTNDMCQIFLLSDHILESY